MAAPSQAGRKWYQRNWIIIPLLVICVLTFDILFPLGVVGLILMWRHARWRQWIKWFATVIVSTPIAILAIAVLASTVANNVITSSVATIGRFCIDGPEAVAAGPNNSVYVLEGGQLLRVSQGGRLLWHHSADANGGLAVDVHGSVFVNDPSFVEYQNRGFIEKFSPSGILLARWPAAETMPALVDRHDVLYADNTLDSNSTLVRRFSPTGRQLGRWRSPIFGSPVSGPGGELYARGSTSGQPESLVLMSARTGKVLQRWPLCHGCDSYDALTTDAHGNLFAGTTGGGNTPFSIAKLTLQGSGIRFETINTAEEQVGQLAVDSKSDIYVIRTSYARPGPSNTGLDELSPAGTVIGTFRPCHPDS